jgi:hypothetical protein
MFPIISPDEQKVLGADIRKNGQRVAITVWKAQKHSRPVLLDGRNRLDAMEAVGIEIRVDQVGTDLNPSVKLFKHMPPDGMWWPIEITELSGGDTDAYVISTNLHRRHLNAEQKRDVIAKMLKATPEKSDRQIAEQIKSNRTTVGQIRKRLETSGDVSIVDTRTDTKGRRQPARKPPEAAPSAPNPEQDPVADDNPVIAQCVADIRERIEEAMDDVARNEWFALTERLHKAINDVSDQRHRAAMLPTLQPDELPDIPEFLRRKSS